MKTTQPTVHPLSLGLLMMVMGIMSPAHANNYTLEQTLANPTPENFDYFGSSVAVGGTTAVVGAIYDDTTGSNSGSAYVFDTTTGNLITTLANPTLGTSDYFGYSVAVDDTIAVVGAHGDDTTGSYSGSAYVFDTITGNLLFTLANPTPGASDHFGYSVAVDGTTAVVGARADDTTGSNSGSAYVFDTTTGNLLFTLANPTPGVNDYFGYSVAVDGTTAVVGAYGDETTGSDSGSAYVFDTTTGNLLFTLANPTPGSYDYFGDSVAVDGTIAVVGARADDTTGSNSGSAYVFDTTTGNLLFTLANPTPGSFDYFGDSVAVDGTTAVVGAYEDETTGSNSGSAYVFDTTTGNLIATLANPTPGYGDIFGSSVSVSGQTVLVSARYDDPNGITDAGSAYVFQNAQSVPEPGSWLLVALGLGLLVWQRRYGFIVPNQISAIH